MFYKFSLLFCIAVGITIVGFGQDIEVAKSVDSLMEKSLNYPKTRRVETSTTYYNEEFLDDYGWLEKNSDSEVQNWMAAQDSFMQSYARNFPQYGAIRKKVSDLSNVRGMMALPKYSRDYVFYVNDDVDGKGYLFRKPTNGGDPEIMSLPFDARAAPFFIPNSQGTYVALGLALPGGYFDWKIYDVQKKVLLPETLRGSIIGNTRLAWTIDGSSFYYVSSDQSKEAKKPRENLSIKRHIVGNNSDKDKLIYKASTDGSKLQIDITRDCENLVVVERDRASTAGKAFYFDLENEVDLPTYLEESATASFVFIGNQDSVFYFETDKDSPRGKIVSVDTSEQKLEWKDVVSQSDETIMGYQSAGGSLLPVMTAERILVVYQKDLRLSIKVFDFEGKLKDTVELPSGGLYFNANGLNALSGSQFTNEVLVRFIGITEPNTILRIDASKSELSVFHRAKVSFNSSDYESKIVFARGTDGTKIPISLTYRKGLKLDGKNYLMMQVYGAIAFVNYPYFQGDYIAWLEMGGIHAVAHIRGGGAYGQKWHQDGIRRNKQNGIDDYISAIKWVSEKGYTSAERTVINGTSAGTIPVAGVLTQAPELVGGAVLHYGMVDMLSYASKYKSNPSHALMIPEIGTPSIKEDFDAIKAYSPYQKIDENRSYPPILALTSDKDTPLNTESYKWVAKMQNLKATNSPQLLQIAWGSNHSGFGSQKHSPIDTFSDELGFLARAMDIKLDSNLNIEK